ncbi:MAG: reprolysin-like metallopeptidase, partial [Aestuariibaculum sp.]
MKLKLLLFNLLMFVCILVNAQDKHYLKANIGHIENTLKATGFKSKQLIKIPTDNNTVETFAITQVPNSLHPELNKKYPGIKSFVGTSTDKQKQINISYGYGRFYGSIKADGKIINFQNQNTSKTSKLVVENELEISHDECGTCNEKEKQCGISDADNHLGKTAKSTLLNKAAAASNSRGATKTTYTIVMTATAYQNQSWGFTTKAESLTRVNAILDYVNSIYRRELAVEYILHPDADLVLYIDPAECPYPDAAVYDLENIDPGTGMSYLNMHRADIDSKYDNSVHTAFLLMPSTIGRGAPYPCGNSRARVGAGGGSNPQNGLVLHELGHHLNGGHTYTHDTSPDVTRLGYSMVGNNSTYIHSYNFEKMQSAIDNYSGCATKTATGNTPPVVSAPIDGLTIPIGTPYALTGTATDVDADADLTYTWQNQDAANSDEATKLQYAHETPSATGNVRYIPAVSTLLNNDLDKHSLLPTVSRTITSRLLVRDNQLPIGAVSYQEVVINVDATAGPFLVTSQDEFLYYSGGDTMNITWDVANTDNANVNVQNVNILLSTDNAVTWTTLLANTANDGAASVTLPNTPSTTCRIKVEAAGNIFYDINNTDFEIVDSTQPQIGLVCPEPKQKVLNENTID